MINDMVCYCCELPIVDGPTVLLQHTGTVHWRCHEKMLLNLFGSVTFLLSGLVSKQEALRFDAMAKDWMKALRR